MGWQVVVQLYPREILLLTTPKSSLKSRKKSMVSLGIASSPFPLPGVGCPRRGPRPEPW